MKQTFILKRIFKIKSKALKINDCEHLLKTFHFDYHQNCLLPKKLCNGKEKCEFNTTVQD